MKKLLSVLLSVLMIFSVVSVSFTTFAADELKIIVASDVHYDFRSFKPLQAEIEKENEKVQEILIDTDSAYKHVGYSGQLYYESQAILNQFFAQAKATAGLDYLIITGDLIEATEKNSDETAERLADMLSDFENETGVQVLVVPGNHDVQYNTIEEFKEIYSAFGYTGALSQDANSGSYTVDLDDTYRFMCMDSTGEGESGNAMTDERVQWVKAECEKAKNEGKRLVVGTHHNIVQHFAFDFIHEGGIIDSSFGLAELFAEYDVKYTFSGHTHANDIIQHKGKNGNLIYEATTGALNAFPLAYRVVTFTDSGVKFEAKSIEKIDTKELSDINVAAGKTIITSTAIAHAGADFMGYAHQCNRIGMKKLFYTTFTVEKILEIFDVNDENNQVVYRILKKVGNKLEEALKMPLYIKDADKDEFSIQLISESYGGYIPESDYKNMLELMVLLYETHIEGGAGIDMSSDEFFMIVHSFAAALNYCLFSISEYEYGVLMKFFVNKLSPYLGEGQLSGLFVEITGRIPADVYAYTASGKQEFERNLIFVTYLISPFLRGAVVDSIPSDKNVTLLAYNNAATTQPETPTQEPTFRDQIVGFFNKIIDWIKMVFKILTFQGTFG